MYHTHMHLFGNLDSNPLGTILEYMSFQNFQACYTSAYFVPCLVKFSGSSVSTTYFDTHFQEIRARIDLHGSSLLAQPPPQQPVYHDSIINRQASEIETLKRTLHTAETQSQKQISKLDHQVALQEAQCGQKMAALNAEVATLRQREEEQV